MSYPEQEIEAYDIMMKFLDEEYGQELIYIKRPMNDGVILRVCNACGHAFMTITINENGDLLVRNRNSKFILTTTIFDPKCFEAIKKLINERN